MRSLLSGHSSDIWVDTVRGVGCIDHYSRQRELVSTYTPPYYKVCLGGDNKWLTTLNITADGAQKQVKNYYDQVVVSQSASRKAVQEHASHAQSLADKLKQLTKDKDDTEKKLVSDNDRLNMEIMHLKDEKAKLYDEKKRGRS